MSKNKLTTQQYWEKYYSSNFDKSNIINIGKIFDGYWDKFISDSSKSIIEIGGYPGRYLSYLASKYFLEPTCLDFNSDVEKIKGSMEKMDVKNCKIIKTDFTKFTPKENYDLVFSIGFIEHFENYEGIMDKHVAYLNPNGRVLIMIPNKRYLRKIYGYLCDYKNLKAHNLKSMRFKVFEDFSKRNNLEIETLEYTGGFPYKVHQKLNIFQKLVYHLFRFLFKRLNPIIEKNPSKYLSGTIICICKKRPN
ncbi:MAG: class I SAM-dependent methyltransferase [Flavobacteriaceae bacterium]|nr:class I SAM-dependent methyltransferase [Flavobacteriaceae bacterium]